MKEKITSVIISTIIILVMIMFIFNYKLEFSYNENRYLAKLPNFNIDNLINNKYLDKLQDYFSDHFPFREKLINIRTNSLKLLNFKEINNVFINDKYLIEKYIKPINTDKLIKKLNNINKNINANMMVMLVPTSISINTSYIPNYYENTQIDTLNYIYDNLDMKTINVYNILNENKDKYQLYYYMDHHWTIYGAYYAYIKYCEENNINYYDLSNYNIYPVSNAFKGTIYSKVLKSTKNSDTIYKIEKDGMEYSIKYTNKTTDTLYDDNYLDKKDKYSYYLSNNASIIEINTNSLSDDELIIIKDSYANSFIPFIVNHYKRVVVIDPRYYKESIIDYINKSKINNILFLYNLNTIDNDKFIYTID